MQRRMLCPVLLVGPDTDTSIAEGIWRLDIACHADICSGNRIRLPLRRRPPHIATGHRRAPAVLRPLRCRAGRWRKLTTLYRV